MYPVLAKVSNFVPTFFTVLNIFDEVRKVIMYEKPTKVGIFNKQLYAFQKYSFSYKANIFIGLSVNMIFKRAQFLTIVSHVHKCICAWGL